MADIRATNIGTAGTQPGSGGFDPFGWAFGGSDRQGGSLTSTLFGNGDDPGLLSFGQRNVHQYQVDPNAGNIDAGPQNQFRDDQRTLATLLAQQANGTGPSLAMNQLQAAGDQNMRQAMALQASQRGPQSAGSFLNIANRQAQIGSQLGQDSANLRLQEQMAARNQLASLLGGARGQDIGFAGQQQQGNLGLEGLNSSNRLAYEQLRQNSYNQSAQNRGEAFNRGVQAIAAGAKGALPLP